MNKKTMLALLISAAIYLPAEAAEVAYAEPQNAEQEVVQEKFKREKRTIKKHKRMSKTTILPIYVYGSEVLREPTKEITKDYPDLGSLITNMFETMYNCEGVGLAAPQIGRSIRMFVVDITTDEDENGKAEEANDKKRVFINPVIYERSGIEKTFNEGCLSVPGVRGDVVRHTEIRIKYLDENFEPHDEKLDGLMAHVVQHEYDHLEGVVFVDLLTPIRKTLLKSKLTAISKGRTKTFYNCRVK